MMKILSIFGTRPEAIKMAPVIKELERRPGSVTSLVCVTAQHRRMLDQALDLFQIRPDYDLDIMKQGQDLFDITTGVLTGLKTVLEKERPDIVLVQGDTTTTMAASLAAYYCRTTIGHVEAGLRTGDRYAPFPEEGNRKMTSSLADLHFAPTAAAQENLLREGVPPDTITVTGNTVVDALFAAVETLKADPARRRDIDRAFSFLDPRKRLILVTGHRRENFGKGFQHICQALAEIARSFPDVEILYPVHLNPNVQAPVRQVLGTGSHANVHLIEPVDYLPFVHLMERSFLILTDSGGVQEEAPSLGKPVLVMRDTTERPEGVAAGTARLVGTTQDAIVASVRELLTSAPAYEAMARAVNPYGDGHAAERIVDLLRTMEYE
jgi:UDP-N-acetylglucosamine 2-epimerase (non-hydrolysing)